MKFEVWIVCKDSCWEFEKERLRDTYDEAVVAIQMANAMRDADHETYIKIVE